MSNPQTYAPDISALMSAFERSGRSGQTEPTRPRSDRRWIESLQSLAHRHPYITAGLLAGFASSGWLAFGVTGGKVAMLSGQPSCAERVRTATENGWHMGFVAKDWAPPSASLTISTATETQTVTVDPTSTASRLSEVLARLQDAGVPEENIVDFLAQLASDADKAQVTTTDTSALTTLTTLTRGPTSSLPIEAVDQT